MHEVEPIIENAVKTLSKAIDLNGSPLEPPKPKAPPKKEETDDFSLESLAQAAAAPAAPAGGLDLSSLAALLGGGAPTPAPEADTSDSSSDPTGGLDLSSLLGGGAASPASAAEEEEVPADAEKQMLMKLLSKI